VWAGVGALAAGSGPVLGGLLVESSWRWIFLINVPVILAALAAGAVVLPRPGGQCAGRRRGERGMRGSQRTGWRIDSLGTVLVLGAVGLVCTGLVEAPRWPSARAGLVVAAGLVLAIAFVIHIRRHPEPLVSPRLFAARRFSAGAIGLVTYYTGFAAMLLGTTLLLTVEWRFPVLRTAACIAPGPITAGVISPFSGRLWARFGVPSTVVTGAVLFAAAGAWPLATAGHVPAYTAVVLPSMLLWGVANALIQPSLFASADAAPQAQLASGSAVLSMGRQLGSAVGVAVLVAVVGDRPAGDLAGFDRAWIVVVVTAVMTAAAGLGARGPARRWNTVAVSKPNLRHSAAAISERESALSIGEPAAREARLLALEPGNVPSGSSARSRHQSCGHMLKARPSGEVLAAGEGRDSHIHDERQR
jgi:hypothetical protein